MVWTLDFDATIDVDTYNTYTFASEYVEIGNVLGPPHKSTSRQRLSIHIKSRTHNKDTSSNMLWVRTDTFHSSIYLFFISFVNGIPTLSRYFPHILSLFANYSYYRTRLLSLHLRHRVYWPDGVWPAQYALAPGHT